MAEALARKLAHLQSTSSVTGLLERWSRGERQAAEELMPLVYDELRGIAHACFRRERADHTLQPTALVHEVYLDLAQRRGLQWNNRSHFFGLAACMMRRALVDYSRRRAMAKRGGRIRKVPLDEAFGLVPYRPEELVALDDALNDLGRLDPLKALIVELRYFGGMSVEEIADCVGQSPRTVARQWRRARALLFDQLSSEASSVETGDGS